MVEEERLVLDNFRDQEPDFNRGLPKWINGPAALLKK
jgi:hypothetical protein